MSSRRQLSAPRVSAVEPWPPDSWLPAGRIAANAVRHRATRPPDQIGDVDTGAVFRSWALPAEPRDEIEDGRGPDCGAAFWFWVTRQE